MKYIAPEYMASFKCDGKLCDSYCCRDWKVVIDENTKNKYKALPNDEAEKILSNVGEDEYGRYFLRLNEREVCPFLGEDSLCKLQKKYGEDFLSDICFSYPRVTHRIGDIIQQNLTLSCPIAAKLVLFSEGISFTETEELPKRLGWCTNLTNRLIFETYPLSLEYIEDMESAGLLLLKNSEIPINNRLASLLTFYENAEKFLDEKEKVEELLNSVESGEFQKNFTSNQSYDIIFENNGYLALVLKLFSALYEFTLTDEKFTELKKIYEARFNEFQKFVVDRNSQIFTNYLMNEFFLRIYPYAFDASFTVNAKVFVFSWEVLKFALFMLCVDKGLDEEKLIFGVRQMVQRMDHSRGAMERILKIAKDC